MPVLKLKPFCRDAIWGGNRLRSEYGMEYDGPNLAEAWVLSCHPDGQCHIANGPFAGKTLTEYIKRQGKGVLGRYGMQFEEFPVLTKLIDAADDLSIQVHPSNQYALAHENQYGKTEMWYILDAAPGSYLYYGFTKKITKQEFARRIATNTLTEVINAVPVKKGDCFFLSPGTLHAIGKGILLAEVQQNSNVTYRVYDYARRDATGHRRPLHVPQAMEVTDLCPPRTDFDFGGHLARCEYFTVDLKNGNFQDVCNGDSFTSLLVLEGSGHITCGDETLEFTKGDSFFLPADSGAYTMTGTGDFSCLKTCVGTD